jgi:CRP-like cAMP-binding protein
MSEHLSRLRAILEDESRWPEQRVADALAYIDQHAPASLFGDRPDVDAVAPTRRGDPATSSLARLMVAPRAGTQRERCLRAVALFGPTGATASQVETTTGMPSSSVSKRLGELERGGWIVADGRERVTKRGGKGQVYVVTVKAADYLGGRERMPSS